jgi:lipopolysaccharide transport protein LptA
MIRFFFLCLVFSVPPTYAQISFQKDGSGSQKEPIHIQSRALQVQPEKNEAHFVGNVLARQGETHISAQAMSVFYTGSEKPESGAQSGIRKIELFEKVRMKVPGRRAAGDYGQYDVAKGLIHMVGNVILQSEDTTLRGKEFVYDMNRKTSRLLSEPSGTIHVKKFTQRVEPEALQKTESLVPPIGLPQAKKSTVRIEPKAEATKPVVSDVNRSPVKQQADAPLRAAPAVPLSLQMKRMAAEEELEKAAQYQKLPSKGVVGER